MYSLRGPIKPVKHLAINLGAPGDRRDAAGTIWLGYPRPGGSLVLQLPEICRQGAPCHLHPDLVDIDGTDTPWLFTCGYRNLRQCVVPVADPEDGTALYTVRLGFCDPDNDRPGRRVFDILIQGKKVAETFDVVAAAGGKNRAVIKEFNGIKADETIAIELRPKGSARAPDQVPVIQTIEVVRERVLDVGMAAPDLLLNDVDRESSDTLRSANNAQRRFAGRPD
ncbi:MAG TPA: hypothetical protein EYP14_03815 [Planctomycetaceae bacterium]|nr:hypothetical protein [Planctomycetaceae bacterium]